MVEWLATTPTFLSRSRGKYDSIRSAPMVMVGLFFRFSLAFIPQAVNATRGIIRANSFKVVVELVYTKLLKIILTDIFFDKKAPRVFSGGFKLELCMY